MAETPAAPAAATPAPASAPPASATATPAQSGSPVAQGGQQPASPPSGEPPRERWNEILDNARKKTRSEVEQEYRQKYAGYDEFERDPISAVFNWLEQAQKHSVLGPTVQQRLQLFGRQQASPDLGEEPKADTPIVDAQGNITGYAFSDKALRQWHAWNQKQLESKLDQRFGTLEQANQERERREELQQIAQQAQEFAHSTLTQLRQQPYFAEHEGAVKQYLIEHPELGDNVHAAFNAVLVTQILPTLSQAEQKQAVQSLTGKAAGSTVAPGGTAPAAPKFKNFRDAAKYYSEHPEEAAAMAKR